MSEIYKNKKNKETNHPKNQNHVRNKIFNH